MNLKDTNVVVTGGSRGLGLGLVEVLAARGAKVTVVARDGDALAAVQAKLGVAVISADITDEREAYRILSEVIPEGAGVECRRQAADGPAGPVELEGFQRNLGDRRQGRSLLDAGGAEDAAEIR
jgi:NAD(P)-dependent dehydrogenase (short-subunit alcohol dehydrogenase family)